MAKDSVNHNKAGELRKESEEELRKEKNLSELLLDSLPHPAMLISKDRNILAANRIARDAGAKVGGFCWQEFGQCLFIPEEDNKYIAQHKKIPDNGTQCYFCKADEALRSQRSEDIEVQAFEKLWDTYWIPLEEDTYLHYAIDVTDRRKAEESLKELVDERTVELRNINVELEREIAERKHIEAESIRNSHLTALGELAAGVAHEINNPINGMINYAQMLDNSSQQGSREQEIAGRLIWEGDRIAGIVNSLLSFAQAINMDKGRVYVQDIMSDSIALTRTQIRNDGITLTVDLPEKISCIIGQPQQIEQVFLNIISNARYALNSKYERANKNKVFKIAAKEISNGNKPYIQISFYDSGHGIEAGILDKIMNPFFTTKPSGVGTGLGLSITHGIVSDHQGRIIFESKEGEFTNVIVELPAAEQINN